MLTDEFKKAAMEKLDNITAEDFIAAFEKISSVKTKAEPDLTYANDHIEYPFKTELIHDK